jgi:fucose permease
VRENGIDLIYVSGLVQGLALVTFPAASSIFTSPSGFGFSASRYGLMFVPQVAFAILAASLGADLARRWTLKRVLQAGLAADLLAMILLTASRLLIPVPDAAYGVLLVATGFLGFGCGAAVMALSTFAQTLSPGREDRSVLRLNVLLGAGTALAPLFAGIFIGAGVWWLMPTIVAGALAGLVLLTMRAPFDAPSAGAAPPGRLPRRFWLFAAAALLYGIIETLNGNWSGPYLSGERGVSVRGASLALTAFWAMVTIGRVLFAAVSSRTILRWIYVGLPLLLIAALQLVSHAGGELGGIVAFGLAGLGCSAFFPLCISLSGEEFPRQAAAFSGGIVAFGQVGYGVAAFGVGPLRERVGLPFHTIYSLGSAVAAALFVAALTIAVRPATVHAHSLLRALRAPR